MENNIQTVGNLFIHIIKLSKIDIPDNKIEIFKETLINILRYKISMKRKALDKVKIELKVEEFISPEIIFAYENAKLSENTFRSGLPRQFIIVISLKTVIFKVGYKGDFCEIFNLDIGVPWDNTQKYMDICNQIVKESPKIQNIAVITNNYLNFKSRYFPWDGRRYEIDYNPIDINGNEYEIRGTSDLDVPPDIIFENDDLIEEFGPFRKRIQKNNNYKYWVDSYDCIYEFLDRLNGEPPSAIFQTYIYYEEDPETYKTQFQFDKIRPKSNLYWKIKYTDFPHTFDLFIRMYHMAWEVTSTVNLLEYVITLGSSKIPQEKLKKFNINLANILRDNFAETDCDKNNPLSDSDIRRLCINDNMPFPIKLACHLSDIEENLLRSNLPRYMKIDTDPRSVIFQIGENGPECRLFQKNSGVWNIPIQNIKPKENINPLLSTMDEIVLYYINYKSKYQPWDNRKLILEDTKIDIYGNITPYVYYEDKTPSLVLENETVLQWKNFQHFSKWFKKGKIKTTGGNFHEFDHYECVKEFISQLNGETPSDNLKLHQDYIDNPEYWNTCVKKRRYLSNLYWDSTNIADNDRDS